MNRREFLAASSAALVATRSGLSFAEEEFTGPPANLLASTFIPLSTSLLSRAAYKPLPTASERARWIALPQEVRDALIKRADVMNEGSWETMLATEELEFKRNGNRSRFEAITFNRRARLGALVLAECVANSGKYLDQIANGIWLICEETFWGAPAHLARQKAGVGLADASEPIIELFSAETASIVAWTAYLLGPQLATVSPLLVPRIVLETKRRILDPYLTRDDFSWMGLEKPKPGHAPPHLNNWNPWINSNVLTATLLLEPDAARRQQLVNKICRSTDVYLTEYSPDAGCEEGPGYWSRSAASYFDVCNSLVLAHGGKGGTVLHHPFVRAMGQYIANVHIAGKNYVDYGDAHIHDAPEMELVYNFGRATGNTSLADFAAYQAHRDAVRFPMPGGGPASLARELTKVFTVGEMKNAVGKDVLPRDVWYSHLGLMTAREKEDSADGLYVAFQGASNGRSHAHNDSGSFMVFQNGAPVFIDVGVGTYDAKTFGPERYTIWTMQSAFHNLPTIGGVMQQEGDRYKASELKYSTSDNAATVSANLATAYPKTASIKHWTRTVSLNRKAKRIEIMEDFSLGTVASVALTFMCAKEPVIQNSSVRVGAALLTFDAAALKATVEKIPLTDPHLKGTWGEAVWRVLLTSPAIRSGKWPLTITAV